MMTPIILVAGTWALTETELDSANAAGLPWWHPQSPFARELVAHALPLIDDTEPFVWSTALDGLRGANLNWYAGGAALRYFAHAKHPPLVRAWRPVSVIAHSHGGQIALYAAAQGLMVDTLVTMATPVRADMERIATTARANIRRWIHVWSPDDGVQVQGAWLDGRWGIYREFALADRNVEEPGAGHSDLHDAARWTARAWWKDFFAEAA